MSTKRAGADSVPALCKALAKIADLQNPNYNPALDGARLDAAELIIKHSCDIAEQEFARKVLLACASEGSMLVQHRVRAIRVLLESRAVLVEKFKEEVK